MTDREMVDMLARALFDLHSAVIVADKYRDDDFPGVMEAADAALNAWVARERAHERIREALK